MQISDMIHQSLSRSLVWAIGLSLLVDTAVSAQEPCTGGAARLKAWERRQQWREVLADYDYVAIPRAYADYMIEHGRDRYRKEHTPLFVTGMDRHTGKMFSPPFPHVKRKPFMPGWERDRECRGSDRNYGNADPLDTGFLALNPPASRGAAAVLWRTYLTFLTTRKLQMSDTHPQVGGS